MNIKEILSVEGTHITFGNKKLYYSESSGLFEVWGNKRPAQLNKLILSTDSETDAVNELRKE